ncbi:hypothetical protein BLNAU_8950 [Blattamonas nauphoetae]|uniref:Uncharacterized protein n=1 Tax=Blattamonas nauphoetae TaxID=2049346 RepID=A0ABQ9XXG4_9EUKA|nr:hypothetical protein BLNAU_8950 [Blattamonas nauphoetae]
MIDCGDISCKPLAESKTRVKNTKQAELPTQRLADPLRGCRAEHCPKLFVKIQACPIWSPTAQSHEHTTNFILSLPICHLFVGSLDLFTTDSIVHFFLDALWEGVSEWRRGTDDVKARGAEILRLMAEEGLTDKLEQTSFTTHKQSPLATSAEMTRLFHQDLGLNYPRGERLPV